MAKRNNGPIRADEATAANPPGATTGDAIEQRMLAFAEQLGRMVGTVQARAAGWMDRETLSKQLTSVRDGAAHLLEQLAGGATTAAKKKSTAKTVRAGSKGRSGGVVDAPGKKRRKRAPTDQGANIAGSQAAKMRTAMPMAKTNRRRGRG
jgi:hypothetical protein